MPNIDLEKLFDFVCNGWDTGGEAFSYELADGRKKDMDPREAANFINKSLQAFVAQPIRKNKDGSFIQAFTASSDIVQTTADVFNVTQETNNFDLLWQRAFNSQRVRQGQLFWEIATTTDGIAFRKIAEGDKIEYEGFEATLIQVNIEKYGAGIGISWETIEGRKLYRFIDQMKAMRTKLFELWANIHYALLAAAGATNQIAYQGTANDSVLDRDIQTLNLGYESLSEDVKDSGYGDTANAPMLLYATPKLRARINQALRVTSADMSRAQGPHASATGFGQIVEYPIEPLYSWNSNIPTDKALLVLPGHKIQNAIYMREKALQRQEIESLNLLKTHWTAFGAAVGDNDQIYELALA